MGVMIAPVEGSGSCPAWMQSVAKPIVPPSEVLENALAEIALEAVREQRDACRAGGQLARHLAGRVRRRARRSAHQEALRAGELLDRGERLLVVDGAHLVDQRAVERAGPEAAADALDLVRPGR